MTGSIQGKTIDASSSLAIEGIEVCAYEAPEFEFAGCTETDAAGEYTLSNLGSGSYKVEFWGRNEGLNYLTQFYNGKSTFAQASLVSVTAPAATPNIDAEMHAGGQIKGKVTDASSAAAIPGAEVCAYEVPELEFGGCALTKAGGEYTISGLVSDSYKVEFWAEPFGYLTQFYNGKSTFSQAEAVLVSAPGVVSGIDAHLSKPVPPVFTPAVPVVVAPTVLPPPTVPPVGKLHCRKGFKKATRHGKVVCVKAKKAHRKHHAH